MMKHLSVLGDRSCNAFGFIYKALSNDQTKSIDDAVDKLVTRVVKFKEARF
jgi:hypothetical protein